MQYRIEGTPLPVVICNVEPGETLITEKGAMSWMSPNMKMETNAGGFGKALGRMFSGESIFLNRYSAQGGPGEIAFATSFPGSIKAYDIAPGREIVAQKSSFLASEAGVELSVFFQNQDTERLSLKSTGLWWSMSWDRDRASSWTPDISRRWTPPAPWRSSPCPV